MLTRVGCGGKGVVTDIRSEGAWIDSDHSAWIVRIDDKIRLIAVFV
jgi:hypothetical protein